MLGNTWSRRTFLQGLGATTTVAALAPISLLVHSYIAPDVQETAVLLGMSTGFVKTRDDYMRSLDADAAAHLNVTGLDLAFVEAVAISAE